jgi:two-component system, response regulator YesN
MYTMMIVDDEPTVRFGLRNYFDWSTYGIDVTEEADDGDVAMEAMHRVQPDIVLTDVRMPNLDGITLSKMIRERYPDVKIVFISGHDDADYLKSALRVSAVDYIFKPVNLTELRTVVERVVEELRTEKSEQKLLQDMQLKLKESMPLLREKTLMSLIRDVVPRPDRIRERLEFLGLQLPVNAPYWLMIISVDGNADTQEERSERDRQLLSYAVQNVCQELVDRYLGGYVFEHQPGEFVAILQAVDCGGGSPQVRAFSDSDTQDPLNSDSAADIQDEEELDTRDGIEGRLLQLAEEIRDNLKRWLKLGVTIGIGERASGLQGLAPAYEQGREAVARKWYLGKNRIITMNGLEPEDGRQYRFGPGQSERLLSVLKGAVPSQVSAELNELFEGLAHVRRDGNKYGRNVCLQVMLLAGRLLLELNVQSKELERQEEMLWELVPKQETLTELRDLLEAYLLSVCERISEKRNGRSNNVVERVRSIIERRYAENGLTVAEIAKEVYLTDTYVSLLFKQETGQTVNEYLTQIRIEKAKLLLQDPRNKFYDICYAVGYADPSYFSKLFKRITGQTPSAYRELMS